MTSIVQRSSNPLSEVLDWFESGAPFSLRGMGLAPYLHVEDYMEDDTFVVRAELPGIDPDKDVTVTIDGDLLNIRGERREEKKEKNRSELHYGSFTRTIRLPHDVLADDVTATYTDGVLEVRVPAGTPEHAATMIPVKREK